MSEQAPNRSACPSEDAERSRATKFTLDDQQRTLISRTATLMIVAGLLQLLATVADMLRNGFLPKSAIQAALFGVVPALIAIAGFALRRAAARGSGEALLAGFRQLFVVFLIKGVTLCLIIAFGLLVLLIVLAGGFF